MENQQIRRLKRNIPLFYVIASLMWMRFFIPVLALFYIASQVPLNEFTIIMAIFSLTIFALEIPTGVLADFIGKKNTLLLSRFCYIIEIAILAFANGFWPFLIAKIISGIGVSLSSGTESALRFDTLKKLKRENEYKKISGNIGSITNVSMAFVFIIGAYLFSLNNKLPAYVSLPLISIGFILTFFLEEPYETHKKATLGNAFKHFKEGVAYFWEHKSLKYLAFFSLAVSAATGMMLSMSSAYLEQVKLPIYLIGTVAFISSMIAAYFSKKADAIENKLGEKNSLNSAQLLSILSVFLMGLMIPYVGVFFYFIISVIYGFFDPIMSHYVNVRIKTSHRATMLSINNLFDNLGIFILFPIIGYLTKFKSMKYALLSFALFLVCYFLILYIYKKFRVDRR